MNSIESQKTKKIPSKFKYNKFSTSQMTTDGVRDAIYKLLAIKL